MRKRNYIIFILFLINMIVIARIIDIAIFHHDKYYEIYNNSINKIVSSSSAPRGRIMDRYGNILVDNKGIKSVIFNKLPGIKENDYINISVSLANILEFDTTNINKRDLQIYYYLQNKQSINKRIPELVLKDFKNRVISKDQYDNFVYSLITDEELDSVNKKEAIIYHILTTGYDYQDKIIKKNITNEEFTKINELNLYGVRIDVNWKRVYNYDTCLNQLFGTIGPIMKEEKEEYLNNGYSIDDIVGQSFIEKYYENYLRGKKALYQVNNDNTLKLIEEEKPGNDLVLNIDIEKQMQIEEVLKKEIIEAKKHITAKYYNGSYIVVSDPTNGEIISLVALKYDNGRFTSDVVGLFSSSFTVGSAIKGASQTVAYNHNVIDINKRIKDGCVKLYSEGEKCSWKSLGVLNDIDALTFSSNYFQFINAIKVSGYEYKRNMKFTPKIEDFDKYRNVFKQYGLGDYTKIDILEEQLGITGSGYSGDLLLNLSIGQYDTYTPLMINQYISTIANGGNRFKLRIADGIINSDGEYININKKEIINKVDIKPEYLKRIQTGLRNVLIKGTATNYINKKIPAAGKTGTSETFYNNEKTYTKTFVAYAPYDNPEYTLTIISPHIIHKNKVNNYNYPLNSRLSRQITNILFEI